MMLNSYVTGDDKISGKDKINFLEVRIVEPDNNTVNNYLSRSFHAGKENANGCADDDPFVYPNPVYGSSFCAKAPITTQPAAITGPIKIPINMPIKGTKFKPILIPI